MLQYSLMTDKLHCHSLKKSDKEICSMLLHRYCAESNFHKWSKLERAGRSAMALAVSSSSTKSLWQGNLSIPEWTFSHMARSYSLPVNARPGREVRNCRSCGYSDETQLHILNCCPANMDLVLKRHNANLQYLVQFLKQHTKFVIKCDVRSEEFVGNQRVDLQIKDPGKKKMWLIDVKCPYDTLETIQKSRDGNVEKYTPYLEQTRAHLPGWQVMLDTLSFGCLGSWCKLNDKVLRCLGLSDRNISSIAKYTTMTCIKWSSRIWDTHCAGHKPSDFPQINVEENSEDNSDWELYCVLLAWQICQADARTNQARTLTCGQCCKSQGIQCLVLKGPGFDPLYLHIFFIKI